MTMTTVPLTPQERIVVTRLSESLGPEAGFGITHGNGGLLVVSEDVDAMIAGFLVMPQLGHDSKVVHGLVHKIIAAEES